MPLDGVPNEPPDSRRGYLARSLRDAIVTGRLAPGERLVERDLSERFRVSRGPVREALRELAQEGLVTSEPYRGTTVAGVSKLEVEQVLVPIRLVLERFALQQSLLRLTEEDLDALEGLVRRMEAAAAGDDASEIVEAHAGFHEAIIERAEHPYCMQIWRTIAPHVRGYFHRDSRRHPSLHDTAREHADLVRALRTRSEEEVLAVLDRHIHTTIELDRAVRGGTRDNAGT